MRETPPLMDDRLIFKVKSRCSCAALFLSCFALTQIAIAQGTAHQDATPQNLKLLSIGNGRTAHGYDMAFRTYSDSEGTPGTVTYASFDSRQAAQQQIDDWIKVADVITSREQRQNESGSGFSDRIEARTHLNTNVNAKVYVIIRRDGMNCYLIQSSSMRVAGQIEALIGKSPSGDAR